MSREGPAWCLGNMTHQGIDRFFGVEAVLRELLRAVVRDELHYLREEILGWVGSAGQAREAHKHKTFHGPNLLMVPPGASLARRRGSR